MDRELLRELFHYCKEGYLVWKDGTRKGQIAGFKKLQKHRGGYQYKGVSVHKKTYQLGRVVFMWHHGKIPKGHVIDHIDRDTGNNRIENLRCVTHQVNMWNRKRQRNNTSGYAGLSFNTKDRRWRIVLGKSGRGICKSFKNKAMAVLALARLRKEYGQRLAQ